VPKSDRGRFWAKRKREVVLRVLRGDDRVGGRQPHLGARAVRLPGPFAIRLTGMAG